MCAIDGSKALQNITQMSARDKLRVGRTVSFTSGKFS